MGQGQINSYQNPNRSSPIEGIMAALQAVHSYYGIDTQKQQAALTKQKTEQGATTFKQSQDELASQKDPESTASQLLKGEGSAVLQSLNDSKSFQTPAGQKQITALQNLISDPNTSGYDVNKYIGSSPMLKDMVQTHSKDMSLQYLAESMANRNKFREEGLQNTANRQYSSYMAPFEQTIQSGNRALEIINKLENSDPNDPDRLKSDKLLTTELQGQVGSMFTGAKTPTVHAQTGSQQDTLYSKIQNALTFADGTMRDQYTPDQLNQMKIGIEAARNGVSQAHSAAYNSFRLGISPDQQSSLDQRYQAFRQMSGLQGAGVGSQNQAGFSPVPGNNAQAATLPKPGEVQDGHRFKGGHPGDPNNWEKVQ